MANERMYLLHTPSGGYCYFAKRMAWGWYDFDESRTKALFLAIEDGDLDGDQDSIEIALDGDPRLLKIYPERTANE